MRQAGRQQRAALVEALLAALPLFVVGVLLIAGWRRWPDILVDFGRELYLPWQVSTGKVLYRDIDHIFGPLSVSFNAVLFRLFGASCTVLFAANIAVVCAFVVFLYRFVRRISSALAASISGCLFAVFGLSQFTVTGNYNFIAPYAHEATHGLMLSLVMISVLWTSAVSRRETHLVLGGVLAGCVLLTKPEIGLAACAAAASFFFLSGGGRGPAAVARSLALFAGASLVPVALFAVYFAAATAGHDSLRFLVDPWRFVLNPAVRDIAFYRFLAGVDDLSGNLTRMAIGAALFPLPVLVSLRMKDRGRSVMTAVRWGLTLYLVASVHFWGDDYLFPTLPLIGAAGLAFLVREHWRGGDSNRSSKELALIMIGTLSLGLLAKMPFNCRFNHYGFFIILPALVLLAVLLLWLLPDWLERRGRDGARFRATMLVSLVFLAGHYLWIGIDGLRLKTFPVENRSGDLIKTFEATIDPRGRLVAGVLQWIEDSVRSDETLLVLPEGIMLNFLTRRRNPTRYGNFMLPELTHHGEGVMLRELAEHPPDVILLVGKEVSEYGVGPFGLDPANGMTIMDWVNAEYRPFLVFGEDPLSGRYPGILAFRRAGGEGNR